MRHSGLLPSRGSRESGEARAGSLSRAPMERGAAEPGQPERRAPGAMIGVIAGAEEHDVVGEFFELFKTPWEFCRDDGRYEVLVCAGDTVRHHSANLVIIYGSQPTAFDRETKSFLGRQRHGATLSWNGDRIPIYERCVTFAPGPAVPDLALEESRDPVVAMTRTNGRTVVRVGYDLFREIRFLLTTGQPPMHAGIPTLERHIAFLRGLIVGAGIPLAEIPPIPGGYRFIACLTHDIDHPSIRLHRFDRSEEHTSELQS